MQLEYFLLAPSVYNKYSRYHNIHVGMGLDTPKLRKALALPDIEDEVRAERKADYLLRREREMPEVFPYTQVQARMGHREISIAIKHYGNF